MKNNNIYIAYEEKDKKIASEIFKKLNEEDQSPFMRCENSVTGKTLSENIEEGVKNAKFAILLISSSLDEAKGSLFWQEYNLIIDKYKEFRRGSVIVFPFEIEPEVILPFEIKEIVSLKYYKERSDYAWYKRFVATIAINTSGIDYKNKEVQKILKDSKGAYDECIAYFTDYNKEHPAPEVVYICSAGLRAFHEKDYNLAVSLFIQSKESGFIYPDIYSKIGACYIKLNRLDEAIAILEMGKKEDGDHIHPTTYYNLGKAYDKRGNLEKAEEAYLKAYEEKQDYVQAINNYAILLKKKGKKKMLEKARDKLKEFVRQNKGNSGGLSFYNLGCFHTLLGEFDEALDNLKISLPQDRQFISAAIKDVDFDPLKIGDNGYKFWILILSNIEFAKRFDNDSFGDFIQEEAGDKGHFTYYYNLAGLAATNESIKAAFLCLKVALNLNPNLKNTAIRDTKLDNLKKGEHSIQFAEILGYVFDTK